MLNLLESFLRCGTTATESPRASWNGRPGETGLLTVGGSIGSSGERSVWRHRGAHGRRTASPTSRLRSGRSARIRLAQRRSNGKPNFNKRELPASKHYVSGMTQLAHFELELSPCYSSPHGMALRWRRFSVMARSGGVLTRLVSLLSLRVPSNRWTRLN